jgi:hypothetical protein
VYQVYVNTRREKSRGHEHALIEATAVVEMLSHNSKEQWCCLCSQFLGLLLAVLALPNTIYYLASAGQKRNDEPLRNTCKALRQEGVGQNLMNIVEHLKTCKKAC